MDNSDLADLEEDRDFKYITIFPIPITERKCTMMCCEHPAEFAGVKVLSDKRVRRMLCCDIHKASMFNILSDQDEVFEKYWSNWMKGTKDADIHR